MNKSKSKRLDELEKILLPGRRGHKVVWQDKDNPDLFRERSRFGNDDQGEVYTAEDVAEMATRYKSVLQVVYGEDGGEK